MKLGVALFVISDAKRVKPPVGCDPAWLGEYTIPDMDDCKKNKGFNSVADSNGVYLELKSNFCPRKCKYNNLPETVQTQCKCTRDRSHYGWPPKFDCYYRFKVKKIKGWNNWGDKGADGKYINNEYGTGKQEACVIPSEKGNWKSWGEWGDCEASRPGEKMCGLNFRKRTRECDSQYCEGEGTDTKACIAYDNYGIDGVHNRWVPEHECSNVEKKLYMPYAVQGYRYHEGNQCVFPSYGKGWYSDTIDGIEVKMGVECEGTEGVDYFDNGDHMITKRGVTCKLVCKNQSTGDTTSFVPKTNHWSQFQCLSPIPTLFTKPDDCFKDPWDKQYRQQCYNDWLEQGLDLKDTSQAGYDIPWYYNRQTWSCPGPGCSKQKELSEIRSEVNKCFKAGPKAECPTELPPLTDFEAEMGTVAADGISWNCDNGNQPGSKCEKTCVNNHIERLGNKRMECSCDQDPETGIADCQWKRTSENFIYVVYKNRSSSCIKGCNASPKSNGPLANRNYEVACDQSDLRDSDGPVDSGDIGTNAVVYMWNAITPVKEGNTCRVRCDDYPLSDGSPREWQMTTYPEQNHFDIECKEENGVMRWVPVGDDSFTACEQVCYDITRGNGQTYGDKTDPIWDCTDKNFIGSTCTKTCPEGFKFDKSKPWQKTSSKCRKKSYGTSWSVTHFKPCVPDV